MVLNVFFWTKGKILEEIRVMERFLLVDLFPPPSEYRDFVTFFELGALRSSTPPAEESCKSGSRFMSVRISGR